MAQVVKSSLQPSNGLKDTRTALSPHPMIPPISISSIDDTECLETPHAVCKTCQANLVNAFEHCLSKNNSSTSQPHHIIRSVYEIDEEKDGYCVFLLSSHPIQPPPYFEIVHDPSEPKNKVFTAQEERQARKLTRVIE